MSSSTCRSIDSKNVIRILAIFKNAEKPTSRAHKRFVIVISMVPEGAVASYGQIAKLAGYSGMARQVVWTLHSSSKKYKLPWHRIVNSKGKVGHVSERYHMRQKALLSAEGIEFNLSQVIDFERFGWTPKVSELKKVLKRLKS